MKYEQPKILTRSEIELAMTSEDSEIVGQALLSAALYEEDQVWAEQVCLGFVEDGRAEVGCLALTCLGHIARIHGELRQETIQKITSLLDDPVKGGYADNALSDYHIYSTRDS